jgi:hypothetical protein
MGRFLIMKQSPVPDDEISVSGIPQEVADWGRVRPYFLTLFYEI